MRRLRIVPIFAVLVAGTALAKTADVTARTGAVAARPDRAQFGTHPRPWADDRLAAAQVAVRPEGDNADNADEVDAAPADFVDRLDEAVARIYLEPVELMADLRAQRAALAAREETVADREAEATAVEFRVQAEVAKLDRVRKNVEDLLDRLDAAERTDLERMVTLYQAMKPKDAAAILADMDVLMITRVVERLPERRAAPILSRLPIETARAVMTTLSDRRLRADAANGA